MRRLVLEEAKQEEEEEEEGEAQKEAGSLRQGMSFAILRPRSDRAHMGMNS